MDLVSDINGNIAPRLSEVEMNAEIASEYHKLLLTELVRMLCAGLVHGDLSEYNILVDAHGPVIIDLPQAVDAAANNNAKMIFERDVNNLRLFFGRHVPEILKSQYGPEIWEIYESGELKASTSLSGKFTADEELANVDEVLEEIEVAREEAEAAKLYAEQRT